MKALLDTQTSNSNTILNKITSSSSAISNTNASASNLLYKKFPILDNLNISSKITKITDLINSLGYKLEGDEEVLLTLKTSEKLKLTSRDQFSKIYKVLLKYVKAKLRMCYDMHKLRIPFNSEHLSVLVSSDFAIKSNLLILIPDRNEGQSSYGVFSKISLVYDSIKKGSMVNFVEMGLSSKYSIMITNPNKKFRTGNGSIINSNKLSNDSSKNASNISNSSIDHYTYLEIIWKELLTSESEEKENDGSYYNKFSNIVIVAHQNASISVIKLMAKFKKDFSTKVKKIIFINSCHNSMYQVLSTEGKLDFEKRCTNYSLSNSSVGTLIYSHSESMEGCEVRSSGTCDETKAHYLISGEIKKYL